MLASELIKELEKAIEEHGDLEVCYADSGFMRYGSIENVKQYNGWIEGSNKNKIAIGDT